MPPTFKETTPSPIPQQVSSIKDNIFNFSFATSYMHVKPQHTTSDQLNHIILKNQSLMLCYASVVTAVTGTLTSKLQRDISLSRSQDTCFSCKHSQQTLIHLHSFKQLKNNIVVILSFFLATSFTVCICVILLFSSHVYPFHTPHKYIYTSNTISSP